MVYKLITKILIDKLKLLLPYLISKEQDDFVSGRLIIDGIILMHEMLHLVKERKEETILLKLDMEKANDNVNWDVLEEILSIFGFGKIWRNWIRECISTPRFLVIINGEPIGYFRYERGLRKGDPISAYIFIIMVKVLDRAIQNNRWREESKESNQKNRP